MPSSDFLTVTPELINALLRTAPASNPPAEKLQRIGCYPSAIGHVIAGDFMTHTLFRSEASGRFWICQEGGILGETIWYGPCRPRDPINPEP